MKKKNIVKGVLLFFVFLWIGGRGEAFRSWIPTSVEISEIAPISIAAEKEWLEFFIQSEGAVDISDWKIQKNEGMKKRFLDYREGLVFGDGALSLAGQSVALSGSGFVLSSDVFSGTGSERLASDRLIIFPKNESYRFWFSWENLPFSLPDKGATIKILDKEDVILTQATYPKTKSFTKNGQKYSAEIWNIEFFEKEWFPLIFKISEPKYDHTKGKPNKNPPSFPEEVQILFSEISPNQTFPKNDFLEIYFRSGPEQINLKYAEIKHNGTTLYFFEEDFWVKPGEFLVLEMDTILSSKKTPPYRIYSSKRKGLSAGSGTYELILFSGTSWEQTEDFVCYQSGELSQTEESRKEKNKSHWQGACVEIEGLVKNESVARNTNFFDTNRAMDFFRHFNGSAGKQNIKKNQQPIANITVQGTGRTTGTVPFTINLTAEDSSDPDGNHDLKNFIWKLDGVVFSKNKNPKALRIDELGNHLIELEVEDFSEAKNSVTIRVFSLPKGSSSVGFNEKTIKTFLKKELYKPYAKKRKIESEQALDGFFDDFLAEVDREFLEGIIQKQSLVSLGIPFVLDQKTVFSTKKRTENKDKVSRQKFRKITSRVWEQILY